MSYTCSYCKNTFASRNTLSTHQKRAQYCLELQGLKSEAFACVCGKKYSVRKSLYRHQDVCEIHFREQKASGTFPTTPVESTQSERILQVMLDKYEGMVKDFQKQITELGTRPTNQNNRNVVMNNMSAITDEQLQGHLDHLTLDFIASGAKGYADYAKCYPLKDNVICTDKARKKIKYKNEDGEVCDDSRLLAQRFFQAISRRNKDILDTAYRDLHNEVKDIVAENRAGEVDITGLLTKATELQTILIKSQRAATGEDDEFAQEFLGHLTKML